MLGSFGADSGITDPRGLRVHPDGDRVYVNNGDDRILFLDPHGHIAAKPGPIANLNPGGGNFGPDGRYYIGSRTARTIMAFPPGLCSGRAKQSCRAASCPSRVVSRLLPMAGCSLPPAPAHPAMAMTRSLPSRPI